jgi:tetratricopeptide (TPR) repeat protein
VKVDAFELAADVWCALEPLGGDPADLAALAWPLGRALERAGRKGEAERLYVSILERAAGDADTLGRVARRLEALGSARFAECLDLAAAAAPTDTVLLDRLVAAYEDQWDSSSVVRVLRRALDATPTDKALLLRLVDALRAAGEDEDILPLVDRALGEQASDEELACMRAELRDAAGDVAGAIADLRVVRDARFAERVNALVARVAARAKELVARGRAEEARTMLEPVVGGDGGKSRRSPALAAAHLELARAHLALDELAEAYEALETGLMIDPKNVSLAMLTGLVAIDLGEDKTAERALLAAAGAGDSAVKALAYYHLAAAAHAGGDVARARRFVGKALSEDPLHDLASALAEKLVAPVAQSG